MVQIFWKNFVGTYIIETYMATILLSSCPLFIILAQKEVDTFNYGVWCSICGVATQNLFAFDRFQFKSKKPLLILLLLEWLLTLVSFCSLSWITIVAYLYYGAASAIMTENLKSFTCDIIKSTERYDYGVLYQMARIAGLVTSATIILFKPYPSYSNYECILVVSPLTVLALLAMSSLYLIKGREATPQVLAVMEVEPYMRRDLSTGDEELDLEEMSPDTTEPSTSGLVLQSPSSSSAAETQTSTVSAAAAAAATEPLEPIAEIVARKPKIHFIDDDGPETAAPTSEETPTSPAEEPTEGLNSSSEDVFSDEYGEQRLRSVTPPPPATGEELSTFQQYRNQIIATALFSFRKPIFLVCLLTKTIVCVMNFIFLSIMPYIGMKDHYIPNPARLYVIISISWSTIVVIILQCRSHNQTRNIPLIVTMYFIGLGISTLTLYILTVNTITSHVWKSCVVFGFGFGLLGYFDELYYQYIFKNEWPRVKILMDTSSCFSIIITFIGIYCNVDLKPHFPTLGFMIYKYLFCIWIALFIAKLIGHCIKRNQNI